MKEINITFLTNKGEEAYKSCDEAGKKLKRKDQAINNLVAKDFIISNDPLVIKIKIKISWLADLNNYDLLIIEGLGKFGAIRNIDYIMVVK